MGSTQIDIKINQTKSLNDVKLKKASLSEVPENSFVQVLAMFNFLDQTPKSASQPATPPLQTVPVQLRDDHSELLKSRTEGTQNSPVSIVDSHSSLINLSEEDAQYGAVRVGEEDWGVQQTKVDSITISSLLNNFPDIRKEIAREFQMVDGIDKLTSSESGQLIQGLTQLISELNSNDAQKSFDIPDNIKEKIEIIMNKLKQDFTYETKPVLSMDKNQVIFSSLTNAVSRVPEENRIVRTPLSSPNEDLTKVSGQPLVIHQQLVPGNELKAVSSPPNLTVSEFAPEVSEWISRYMKITNGQSGSTEAKFSLYPEHLGHIEIKIHSQQGQISAQILTDTPIAKEVLEGQLQHLRAALQQSGLHVQKLDIVQQSPVAADPNQAGLSFSQDGSHSSREQRAFTPSQDDGSKEQKESTEQKERDRESLAITYGGSTRKTTSRIDFTA